MTIESMVAWREGLRYRILYGFACWSLQKTDCTRDRTFDIPTDVVLAEVLRIATVDGDEPADVELARQAVEDARAGRGLRW